MGGEDEPGSTTSAPTKAHGFDQVDTPPLRSDGSLGGAVEDAPLPEGTEVGRYRLRGRLGAGGMGVVYRAHDPELDRDIAVKLLLAVDESASHESPRQSSRQARVLREAQAMARLAHPNVVAVHDVGTFGDNVFIAMELVVGTTLRQYQEGKTRAQILEAYVGAGRGLAAAHAAQLVHRDFKPDNVLVGEDGRARVTDFGLVRAAQDHELERRSVDATTATPASGAFSQSLTRTDVVMGTPAYMAPEQHEGRPADARADQFGFCVALYEALYGERPFRGKQELELRRAVITGRVADPPPGSPVPLWLRRVLLRGLMVEPEERWPSIEALLEALMDDPEVQRQRRKKQLALGLVVSLLVGASLFTAVRSQRVCRGAERELAGVWDPAVRAQIGERLRRVLADPQALVETTERLLDDYSRRWVEMHEEACKATRVYGSQPDSVLELRMSCLLARRRELTAFDELFASADAALARHAPDAAAHLTPIETCADVAALSELVPPPEQREKRAVVTRLDADLSRLQMLTLSRRYEEALAGVARLEAEASRIDYAPLLGRVLLARGKLADDSGDHKAARRLLRESFAAAFRGRDDATAARAATHLVSVEGFELGASEEAQHWARIGRAALTRHPSPAIEADLLMQEGLALSVAGQHTAAVELTGRAVQRAKKVYGVGSLLSAHSLDRHGYALRSAGHLRDAIVAHEEALAIFRRDLGPLHPNVSASLGNMAMVHVDLGDFVVAEKQLRESLRIIELNWGEHHPDAAHCLTNLADTLRGQNRCAEAVPLYRRALAILEPKDAGSGLIFPLLGGGDCLRLLGGQRQWIEARDLLQRALTLAVDVDPIFVGCIKASLGETLWELGSDRKQAVRLVEEALAIHEKAPRGEGEAKEARAWLAKHQR